MITVEEVIDYIKEELKTDIHPSARHQCTRILEYIHVKGGGVFHKKM